MKDWLRRFMYGRYGQDHLNRFLSIVALIILVASMITRSSILNTLALIILIFNIFRMFSRNLEKRRQENMAYIRLRGKVMSFFNGFKSRMAQRNTHRFYKCPSCRQQLRVPKGKGRISIRCPKCQTSFEKKT
ncbi:MAG: zinc finger domain-containing protein [Christensenellales bacterium]|jgi:LSD1 subclass zinc finger protein